MFDTEGWHLVYLTFNTGVHEKHLFLASILAVLLWSVSREHTLSTVITVLMSNINLFVFHGVDGWGLRFDRAIVGTVDTALLLALFSVCYVVSFWTSSILRSKSAVVAPRYARPCGNSPAPRGRG